MGPVGAGSSCRRCSIGGNIMRKIITIIIAAVAAAAAVTGTVFAVRSAVLRKKAAEDAENETVETAGEMPKTA